MGLKIDHVAITVANMEESIKWYEENLEATALYSDETWGILEVGNTKIALMTGDKHKPHIAFRVEDMSRFDLDEVKVHRDGVLYVYREDPDGNCVEWVCYKQRRDL